MWIYHQGSGELLCNGTFQGTGYSGRLEGRNSHASEAEPNIGPIPCGQYVISPAETHPRLGRLAMRLTPTAETNTHGRAGFFIHGDNARHDASHGCIILGPSIRQLIAASNDRGLEVLP